MSLDPNLRKELRYNDATEQLFARLVATCDLLLPSGEELERAAGVEGREAALARLFELGVGEVVLKRGADGRRAASARRHARSTRRPSLVEEVDPTGAGDCFGGAYVACRTARHAARAGALNMLRGRRAQRHPAGADGGGGHAAPSSTSSSLERKALGCDAG